MDLIIGAGITGLSYAMFKGDNDYIIIEKESEIGGIVGQLNVMVLFGIFLGIFFIFKILK